METPIYFPNVSREFEKLRYENIMRKQGRI